MTVSIKKAVIYIAKLDQELLRTYRHSMELCRLHRDMLSSLGGQSSIGKVRFINSVLCSKLLKLTFGLATNSSIFIVTTVMDGSVLAVRKPGLIPNTGYIIKNN